MIEASEVYGDIIDISNFQSVPMLDKVVNAKYKIAFFNSEVSGSYEIRLKFLHTTLTHIAGQIRGKKRWKLFLVFPYLKS